MTCRQQATVTLLAVKYTGVLAGGYSYTGPTSIRCQITPMSAQSVVERTGRELDRPHLLMTDVRNNPEFASLEELAALLAVGGEVEDEDTGAKYSIETPAEIWGAGVQTNCVSCVLRRMEYA